MNDDNEEEEENMKELQNALNEQRIRLRLAKLLHKGGQGHVYAGTYDG